MLKFKPNPLKTSIKKRHKLSFFLFKKTKSYLFFSLLSGTVFFLSSLLSFSLNQKSLFSSLRRNTSRAFSLVFNQKTFSIPLNKMQDVNLDCIKNGEIKKIKIHAEQIRFMGNLCSMASVKHMKIKDLSHDFQITHFLLKKGQSFSSDYISLNRKKTHLSLDLKPYQGPNVSMDLLFIRK